MVEKKRRRTVRTAPVAPGGPEDIQAAWRLLAGGAADAAQTLADISRFGRSEVARVQASQTILDRVGLGARPEIIVRTVPAEFDTGSGMDASTSPAEIIAKRLAELQQREIEPAEPEHDEVVDAELVEDVTPWAEPVPSPNGRTPGLFER